MMRVGRVSDFCLPLSPAAFLLCFACVASRALNLPLAPFELLTKKKNNRSISQGEKVRERERRGKYNCQWPCTLQMLHLKSLFFYSAHTHMHAPGHVTLPLSKVNWMNKEMAGADKENKKNDPNGREWGINSVGRWVLVSICAILIHWIETRSSTKP